MLNHILPILLPILAYVTGAAKYSSVLPRLAGGEFVDITAFPHTVAIFERKEFRCAGSYIKPNWILTAAHCVADYVSNGSFMANIDYLVLRMGIAKLTEKSGQTRNSATVILHEDYDRMQYRADMALIGIKDPFDLDTKVQMINLSRDDEADYVNRKAFLAGWGCNVFTAEGALEHMRSVEVAIISRDKCFEIYQTVKYDILPDTYCAQPPHEKKNACHGDTGAALIFNEPKLQIAVVSLGLGCGRVFPGVYASVAFHKEWIMTRSEYHEYLERGNSKAKDFRFRFGCYKILILMLFSYGAAF